MPTSAITTPTPYTRRLLRVLYLIAFLFFLHFALTAYVNSSFLETFTSAGTVGLIYTGGALLALGALLGISHILNTVGNYVAITSLIVINFLTLVVLAFAETASVIVPAFIVYAASNTLIMYCLDIFVASYSRSDTTGTTRGLLLTSQNIGWVAAPLVAGVLVSTFWYQSIYLVSLFFILGVYFLIRSFFSHFTDPVYTRLSLAKTATAVFRNTNLRNIYGVSFLLQFLGAFMVIYTPIYLHEYIGLAWNELGIIFAIMLTAYIFFELPEGKLADRKYGEKEILIGGMCIAALSVGLIAFLHTTALLPWIILLFATRIGASTMEVMSESYFFKQVKADNAEAIGFYRTAAPLAYIAAPLCASAILAWYPYPYLFIFLAIVLILGIVLVLPITDTK